MAQNAIPGPWPAQERILCCIDDSPAARDAIRTAKRGADRARADWIALTVTSTRGEAQPDEAKDRLAQNLRLAERLGAEVHTIQAEARIAAEILDFARRSNVRRIVIGRPRPRGWLDRLVPRLGNETVAADIIAAGGAFEVTLVAEEEPRPRRPAGGRRLGLDPSAGPWLGAAGSIAAATAIAAVIDTAIPVASLSLIYMTAVIVTATRFGLWPSLLAAGLGFLSYNFFFTEPRHTFFVVREHEVLTLGAVPRRLDPDRQPGRAAAAARDFAAGDRRPHRQSLRLLAPGRRRGQLRRRGLGGGQSCRHDAGMPVGAAGSGCGRSARHRRRVPARGSAGLPRDVGGAICLGSRGARRPRLGDAACLGLAVPADPHRRAEARGARDRLGGRPQPLARRPPSGRCADRPDRSGAGADAAVGRPRPRPRGLGSRAAQGRALVLGQPRPANTFGFDHRRRQRARRNRGLCPRRIARPSPRRFGKKASGWTDTSRTCST